MKATRFWGNYDSLGIDHLVIDESGAVALIILISGLKTKCQSVYTNILVKIVQKTAVD